MLYGRKKRSAKQTSGFSAWQFELYFVAEQVLSLDRVPPYTQKLGEGVKDSMLTPSGSQLTLLLSHFIYFYRFFSELNLLNNASLYYFPYIDRHTQIYKIFYLHWHINLYKSNFLILVGVRSHLLFHNSVERTAFKPKQHII